MNTKKILGVGAAILLLLMTVAAAAPTASADKHSPQGNLSRTFDYYAWLVWQEQHKQDRVGGIGWFDPDDRDNNCLIRVFGPFTVGSGFYYDTLRIKAKTGVKFITTLLPETFLGVGCPLATADDDADIGTTELKLKAGTAIAQSHLLCLDTFSVCTPKDDTATWTLVECKGDKPTFTVGDLLLAISGGLIGGPPFVGSSAAECDTTTPPNIYDVSNFLLQETDNQTSEPVFVDWVKKGSETGYIISCFETEYNKGGVTELAQSHDWILNYNPADGQAPIVNHLVGGTHPLKGLYDLSGDNECPHKGVAEKLDKKDDTFP